MLPLLARTLKCNCSGHLARAAAEDQTARDVMCATLAQQKAEVLYATMGVVHQGFVKLPVQHIL